MGTRQAEQWRRNLAVLWLGTFIAGMGFSEVMPFISLYVDDLGHFTKGQLTIYSGLTYAVTFLVIALVSPLWGKLADRKGRKLMLLRSSLGMAVVIGLMGFVTNVWQLIGLRFLQGFFAGYIPNASALIAAETPQAKSGNALGILTTGYVSGNLIGPVLGGILAQVFSIRWTFILTGIFLVIVFILSATLVHEHFTPISKEKQAQAGFWLGQVKNPTLIIVLLVSTMFIQMGNNSITPIISLYVRQLMGNQGPITLVAGIVAALPGISTLMAAPKLGEYGDRKGTQRVLIFGYAFAVLMYFHQGFVTSVRLLGLFRFMIVISDGALFPAVQTMLTKNVPHTLTGTVFSWNQSFQALGSMLGSMLGGFVANWFNYNGVFIFTAFSLLLNFLLLWWLVPEIRQWRGPASKEASK